MTLGIHMGTLRGAGAGAVGRHLAAELVRASDDALHFWVPDDWPKAEMAGPSTRARIVVEARPATGLRSKLVLENVIIRGAIRRGIIDRLFSLGDTSLPACGVPHMLMVQQAFLAYPRSEWGMDDPALSHKMTLMNRYFQLGLPSVDLFTVQTATMKRRLAERWQLDPDRIAVVPSSIPPEFLTLDCMPAADPPYICFVGSAYAHKNHAVIADVLAALRGRGLRIGCRVTGTAESLPRLVQRARTLDVLNEITFVGQLDTRGVCDLLQRAVAMIMPSRLESFGLPYYEAMAAGCPVLAADLDFARDACADAALYARPADGAAFARHVEVLLTDPDCRPRLARAGRARMAAAYRPWSSIARDYLELARTLSATAAAPKHAWAP